MDQTRKDEYLVSKGYAWYVFFLLFTLMCFDFMDRQLLTVLFPYIQQEWGLSDAQCGILAAAVSWSITVFAIPVAVLADRWSRTKTIGLMSLIWSVANIACAFTRGFSQLFTARFLLGTGEAGYVPAGNALISALFPARLRATLIGLFMGAGSVGAAAGVVLGGWIATTYGWRHAIGIIGIPGLFFAILFFFVRDYKTVKLNITTGTDEGTLVPRKMRIREIMADIAGKKSLLLIYLAQTLGNFFVAGTFTWLPTYMHRVQNLPMTQASAKTGLMFVVCIIGNYLVGVVADKWVASGRANARPLTAAAIMFMNFLVLMAAFALTSGNTQFLLFLAVGVFGASFNAPYYTSVAELTHPGLRSTATSLMILVQNLLGLSLGPIMVGVISDWYNLTTGLIVLSFAPALSAVFGLLSSLTYNRDLAKVEKVELEMEEPESSVAVSKAAV